MQTDALLLFFFLLVQNRRAGCSPIPFSLSLPARPNSSTSREPPALSPLKQAVRVSARVDTAASGDLGAEGGGLSDASVASAVRDLLAFSSCARDQTSMDVDTKQVRSELWVCLGCGCNALFFLHFLIELHPFPVALHGNRPSLSRLLLHRRPRLPESVRPANNCTAAMD